MKAITQFSDAVTLRCGVLAAIAVLAAHSETLVNSGAQGQNVDFTQGRLTRPEQTGSTLRATGIPGQLFSNLPAAAGQNLYSSVAADSWAVVATASGLNDPSTSGLAVRTGLNTTPAVAALAGTVVGTTDTQALTNETLDGMSPTTMTYLDGTSSIQTQLNSKQSTLALPLSEANGGTGLASPTGLTQTGSTNVNCTIAGAFPNNPISCAHTGSTGLSDPGSNWVVVRRAANTTSAIGAPAAAIVATTDTQTRANKSIDASELNSGVLSSARVPAVERGLGSGELVAILSRLIREKSVGARGAVNR